MEMNDVADHHLYDQVVEILGKVRERQPAADPPTFNEAQIGAIKEMAEVWMGFRTMGHVAVWLQKVLKYVGWAAGGLILYKGWAAGWFNVR